MAEQHRLLKKSQFLTPKKHQKDATVKPQNRKKPLRGGAAKIAKMAIFDPPKKKIQN